MEILSAEQMRDWDEYTIQNEPISSADLMERSAGKCVQWLLKKNWQDRVFNVFCGKGNNGGDGLIIARQLITLSYKVQVYALFSDKPGSKDFELNRKRVINETSVVVKEIKNIDDLPSLHKDDVVVDALFGSGFNKPLEGVAVELIQHLNKSDSKIISIDLPSGLWLDRSSINQTVVEADYTLTFQAPKKALLLQENADFVGEVVLLPIGLSPNYLATTSVSEFYLDRQIIQQLFKKKQRFAHRGTYGHAAIIAGSWGKMGAAVLAAHACLRTGAGLTTAVIPKCGYTVFQISLPEVMVMADEEERKIARLPTAIENFSAIGIGPGMGSGDKAIQLVSQLLQHFKKPIVIDADGLNCLAKAPQLVEQLPSHSILAPHPKEFERLFGKHTNDFERTATAVAKAKELNLIVVFKGHHTMIALPDGRSFYNSTGNAGMAKGGSGDVLTGIITSLLAQGYKPTEAALLGVNIHGWAGDVAAKKYSKQAMTPSDLIDSLAEVFLELEDYVED